MQQTSKIEKLIQNHIVQAVVVNLVYLVGNIVLFKPYLNVDDYVMSTRCYGVYTGTYGYDLTYIHFLYGKMIQALMNICNQVPWYTVVFYILLFSAFVLFSYVVLEQYEQKIALIIINLFLLFFAYDSYISIQFTQVAGIIGAVGMFVLIFPQGKVWEKIVGGLLLLFSCLIRYQMAELVFLGYLCAFILSGIINMLIDRRKVSSKKGKMSRLGLIVAFIILIVVPQLPSGVDEKDVDFWDKYWKYNNVRASIQDYEYPEYGENEKFYQSMGISENDLYLYNAWNTDVNTISLSDGMKIMALQKKLGQSSGFGTKGVIKRMTNPSKIFSFFKIFPLKFMDMDLFGAIWCLAFIFILGGGCLSWMHWISLGVPFVVTLAMNYYMYVCNRYLQHRVDVGVFCMFYLLEVLYIYDFKLTMKKQTKITATIMLLCVVLCGNYHYKEYNYLTDESILNDNRLFFQQTNLAETNIYSVVAERNVGANTSRVNYSAFEVPPLGLENNVYYGNSVYDMERLKKQNINDVYMFMVNNNRAYLVMDENNKDLNYWKTYFDEHTGEECRMVESMTGLGKKVYRVFTESYYQSLCLPNEYEDATQLVSNVRKDLKNQKIYIEGDVYLNHTSGFQQEMYLQIADKESGEQKVYLLTKKTDLTKKKTDSGYYSYIKQSIKMPIFFTEDDEVSIIVEQDNKYYKVDI